MRILILGGNRFVGADLVSRMVLDGHDVTVAALDPPLDRVRSHVRFINLDRRDREVMSAALEHLEFDVVLDNIAFKPSDVELFLEVMEGRIGRYVLTSSVDIYPASNARYYAERHEVLSPSDLQKSPSGERYLRGKRGCEKVLRASTIPWSVVRPAMVFGLSDPVAPPPQMLHGMGRTYGRSLFFPCRVVDCGPILLRQDERRVFSLVSSQDVASALAIAATHPNAEYTSFNIAGDEIWTLERMIRAMGETMGLELEVVRPTDEEFRAAGLGDYDYPYRNLSRWSVVNNRRLKSLGWTPTPAEISFSRLLEAVPPECERPFYDRRLREIALGQHVMSKRSDLVSVFLPKVPPRRKRPILSEKKMITGEFSGSSVETFIGKLELSAPGAFRYYHGIPISTIGIGTHRGLADANTNETYHQAILHAVRGGINVIDTAINYRYMLAERTVGHAVADLVASGIPREALCVCSKGGFVPSDGDDPRPPYKYIWDEYVAPGLIDIREAMLRHTLRPRFIRKLLEQSLVNLGLEHIDLYYLHNPERARAWMGEKVFFENLRESFAILEQAVKDGQIGCYGIATWTGLRVNPDNDSYISLEKIQATALDVGGYSHHFKAVQLPLNASNKEALFTPTQIVKGRAVPALEAASLLGLHVFTSAAVYRGQELPLGIRHLLDDGEGTLSEIQKMLNFARSAEGSTTALVGMRKKEYAEKALQVLCHPMMTQKLISKFAPATKPPLDVVEPYVTARSEHAPPSLVTPSLATPLLRTLVAGGDVMLGRDLPGYAAANGRQKIIGDLPPLLSSADITLVNLECVLSNRGDIASKGERRPFHYRCPPEMVNLLVELGVSVVATANNHSFDYGSVALEDQKKVLRAVGIAQAGSGSNLSEASRPVYLVAGNTTVGLISFETETRSHAAEADKPGVFHVPLGDEADSILGPVIKEARYHADLVVVSPHWGLNWKEVPSQPIRRLGKRLIDLGADAVLGHGAHILQGIEVHRGCPVVYDMGGLIFDRNSQSRMRQSAVFELGFNREGIKALAVHPISLMQNATTSATGETAHKIRDLVERLSTDLGSKIAWRQVEDALVVDLAPERELKKTSMPPTINHRDAVTYFSAENSEFPSMIIHQKPPSALTGADGLNLGGCLEVLGYRHPDRVQPGFSFLLEVLFKCPQTGGDNWTASVRAVPIDDEGAYFEFKHPVADGLWVSSTWSAEMWISDYILMRPPANAKAGRYQLSWSLVNHKKGCIWPGGEDYSTNGWVKLGEIALTDDAPKGVAGINWGRDVIWRPLGPDDVIWNR